jgi:hypothetical protein
MTILEQGILISILGTVAMRINPASFSDWVIWSCMGAGTTEVWRSGKGFRWATLSFAFAFFCYFVSFCFGIGLVWMGEWKGVLLILGTLLMAFPRLGLYNSELADKALVAHQMRRASSS